MSRTNRIPLKAGLPIYNSNGKEKVNLVWLKRDLRINDHAPLARAVEISQKEKIPALAFYVCESDYWKTNKASNEQLEHIEESLLELTHQFNKIGGKLHIFHTPTALETFKVLLDTYDIQEVFTHQETGNNWTFQRDKNVEKILDSVGVPLREFLQNGVTRGYSKRFERLADSAAWWDWVKSPLHQAPTQWNNPTTPPPERLSQWRENFRSSNNLIRQKGGEREAQSLLTSFLNERAFSGKGYRKELGSPLNASTICSRLSPHLTWGSLSTKTAAQWVIYYKTKEQNTFRKQQYESFLTRLHWRDHFIQKFESICWMEHKCINPAMENARPSNPEYLQRYLDGETGYPFVDACMRSLTQGFWINFRARALLVSFAAYALNLDWRDFGTYLAQRFLDYEPGIHYSQLQMQSGTTLSAPPRIYSPIKQSLEKDPKGEFIRRWIPELRELSDHQIHYPYPYNSTEKIKGYPKPIFPMENLLSIMRAHAPRKKTINNQLELSI